MCRGLLKLTLLLISSLAQAQTHFILPTGSFVKTGDALSKQVDLSGYFADKIEQMESGSCHIFAATSLVESFCAQVTGKKIDLSEAYFFYRHLSHSLAEAGIDVLSSGNVLGKVQGGYPYKTLERFKNGSVCTKEEFGLTERGVVNLVKSLQAYSAITTKKLKADYEQDNAEAIAKCKSPAQVERELESIRLDYTQVFNARLCGRFDNQAKCHIPAANINIKPSSRGEAVKTNNPYLKKCIAAVDRIYVAKNPTTAQMVDKLDKGYPFLCRGTFVATAGSGMEDQRMELSVGHAIVVHGYRKNKKTLQVEYLVRDANFPKSNPYTVTGCDEIMVIVAK